MTKLPAVQAIPTHITRGKTVTLSNYWTGALLEDITMRQALTEMRAKTHPMDQSNTERDIRNAFLADDGKALFSLLRT